MKKEVTMDNWNRKRAFNIFSKFDDPYTGITTILNITNLVLLSKKENKSFYGTMLYYILLSMNEIEEFKYGYGKINNTECVCKFDELAATVTVLQNNGELNFTRYIKFEHEYEKFMNYFNQAKIDAESGIEYYKIDDLDNMNKIQVTCLPWIRFTNFKNAVNFSEKSSKPKICWGKYYTLNNEFYIDFSILVNHAFQDGYHISQFINNLTRNINNIKINLEEKVYEKRKKYN